MLKGWLFALAVLALCAGVLAAEPPAGPDLAPAAAPSTPAGKLPTTRAEMAVTVARALAGGDEKVPPAPLRASYWDVRPGHWAFRYIEYAKSMEVVSGYADGSFRPEAPVNRAQMAVFLARALVAPQGDSGLIGYRPTLLPTFTDVSPDFWAYAHIEYLTEPVRKIAQGNPDGSYHPEQWCTRDDLTALLARAFPPPKPPAPAPLHEQDSPGAAGG